MSTKCGLKVSFIFILSIIIVNGYAKDITGVEKGHRRLNEYISHYETLDYDHEPIKASHNRAKRSVTKDHYVNLKFSALGRDFHLRLKRDLNTFSDKLEFYDSNGPIDVATDHIYEGDVIGEPNSYVFGSIREGVFEGKIITERDAYYVEHAKHYFAKGNKTNRASAPTALRHTSYIDLSTTSSTTTTTTSSTTKKPSIESPTTKKESPFLETTTPAEEESSNSAETNEETEKKTFHSIIYKDSHVEDPYQDIREGHVGGCGITDEVSQWMENIQNSAVEELPEPMSKDDEVKQKQKLHKKRTPTTSLPATQEDEWEEGGAAAFINSKAKQKHNQQLKLKLKLKQNNENENGDENADGNDNRGQMKNKIYRIKDSAFVDTIAADIDVDDNDDEDDNDNSDSDSVSDSDSDSDSGAVSVSDSVSESDIEKSDKNNKNDADAVDINGVGVGVNNAGTIVDKIATFPDDSFNKYKSKNKSKYNNKMKDIYNKSNTNDNNDNKKPTNIPPKKKYASVNNGASDDFKYPYQKYTKEANLRFESLDESITGKNGGGGGGGSGSNKKDFKNKKVNSFNTGIFYDPETGRKFSPTDDDWHERVHERVRRASGSPSSSGRREDNKNTCSLYIQTDPLIWRHIREGIADHDRGRKYEIDVKTREEITSLIAHHVTAVNYIYRNTKFDGRTEHRNIRFEVQRIKIDDDSACRTTYNGPHNAFCNEHMDVSNFLNLHSLEDHSDFCLAYVFTYRDFSGGTLGLAWVASASGASGGICEKFKTYTETVGGQYQSTKRSLNTGIITFVNYNSRVPPKVSQLTLAHEIGHNFGSPHDFPLECRPGGLNGNYIMFASATSGDRPNNSKFSPCSIRNISNVLDVLVGNQKRDCFKASEGAFCGNKIVESGEECDCGFNEDECKDNCCYPRLISEYDMSLNSSAKGCTRRAKTQCSPSQGPCCLANSCTFVPTNFHQKCKEETECSWSSTCNGTTAECPEPKPRDDKTKCNNGTALCIKGECSGSICLLWNMTECFLTSQTMPNVDKRKLCELACQNGNDSSTCRSTSEFADLYGLPKGGISLRPGSPCDNFQGYCDVFLKCRAVDADGPLVRLKNLLLNRETLLTLAQWITDNWYIVVLMGIGFILVMGAFIKCCAVHTPSSNPKKRRARRISETLRAPMNTLRRMRHPHGRGAGPRSIPPPAHEGRHAGQHHHRHHGPGGGDWDRRGGGHSIVPLPTGGPPHHHSTRSGARPNPATSSSIPAAAAGPAPSSSSSHANRSSRSTANNGRPVSGSRSGHGYAEQPPSGSGGSGLVSAGGNGAGLVSRAQMPLPLPPTQAQTSQQQQQQQLPQQQAQTNQPPYYAPKEIRNKSRSSRSSSKTNSTSTSAVTQTKDTHKSGKNRRKVVY